MRLLLSFGLLALLAASAAGNCMFWTPWINADNNYRGKGDFETVGYNNAFEGGRVGRVTKALERRGIICSNPAKIECRVRSKYSKRVPWYQAGDTTTFPSRINCETRGIVCRNKYQADGKCADYEVRLLCWKPCGQMEWTRWTNKDGPSGSCDCEHPGMADHPVRNGRACPDGGSPLEIQCQTTKGVPASLTSDPKVKCDVINGFSCFNNRQPDRRCEDYRVRYLCFKSSLYTSTHQHKYKVAKKGGGTGGSSGIIPVIKF